ncbi:hypothetical protein V5O48_016767 [Marasmius crinis-equi]|uniref:Uncharacterized protein n=1 Tax=Marasmius crinis-equi TaxID=585013 RepID=A0ABR3EQU9_9AGAR
MPLLNAVAALSLVVASNAQNVIKVAVGWRFNESLYNFSPNDIEASNGDVIQFEFSGAPANHSSFTIRIIGMVGAINAPRSGDNSAAGYFLNADAAGGITPGQGIGGLVGQGASASAFPGPITGDVQYFGTPTTGVASSTSTTTSSTNAASTGYINPALVLVAAMMGNMLA